MTYFVLSLVDHGGIHEFSAQARDYLIILSHTFSTAGDTLCDLIHFAWSNSIVISLDFTMII